MNEKNTQNEMAKTELSIIENNTDNIKKKNK